MSITLTELFKQYIIETTDEINCESQKRHYAVLLCVADGKAEIVTKKKNYTVNQGEICLLRPLSEYCINSKKGKYRLIYFDIHTFDLPNIFVDYMYGAFSESDEITIISEKTIFVHTEKITDFYNYQSQYAFLLTILSEIAMLDGLKQSYELFNEICVYTDRHSAEPLEAKVVAQRYGMSYSLFAKRFREKIGRTYKEHIGYIRIVKAKTLLCTSAMDISAVAKETGYFDSSHLIRCYRKYFGFSPKFEREV